MFSTTAPTIEQYLSLDEVLVPYIDNNQELYNFYVLNNFFIYIKIHITFINFSLASNFFFPFFDDSTMLSFSMW